MSSRTIDLTLTEGCRSTRGLFHLAANIVDCMQFRLEAGRPMVRNQFDFFEPGFAVPDAGNPARWFLGFPFRMRYDALGLLGVVAYFRSDGSCDSKTVLQELVATYSPDAPLVGALSNHSLVLASRHEHRLRLQISWLTRDDCVLAHTDLADPATAMYLDLPSWLKDLKCCEANKSCLELQISGSQGSLYLDAGSLRRSASGQYAIDLRSVDLREEKEGCEVQVQIPREFGDGYPLVCVVCGQETLQAEFYGQGLGASCCPGCAVWFSKSAQAWTCCAVLPGCLRLCDTELDGQVCPRSRRHCPTVTLDAHIGERGLKYPFRPFARLTVSKPAPPPPPAPVPVPVPGPQKRKRGRPRKAESEKTKKKKKQSRKKKLKSLE
jgi:hypothetical protein